jgi:hypothetical protein
MYSYALCWDMGPSDDYGLASGMVAGFHHD